MRGTGPGVVIAFLSDIHANGDALDAVARGLARLSPDVVYHLGDLVGYNAEPEACVRWAMEHTAGGILGNHDAVACGKASGEFFNPAALVAAQWSRDRLSREAADYLLALPDRIVLPGDLLLVHGAPSDPDRYLFTREDAAEEMDTLAAEGGPRVVFFGHTHVPAAYLRRKDGRTVPAPPAPGPDGTATRRIEEGTRAMLNPGSVGQPRDRDPRSSFLLYDAARGVATWVRIPYDIAACQRKVISAGLPRFFATRLAEGT